MKKLPKVGTKAHKELKWKESIEALNIIVNTRLAPSKIEGVGVFALRDFKKGEKMYQNVAPSIFDVPYSKFNKLNRDVRKLILQFFPFKTVKKDSIFWYPVNSMQAYINHPISIKDANYDGDKDIALKSIKKGEEILQDYTVIPGYDIVYPWLAKKKNKDEKK